MHEPVMFVEIIAVPPGEAPEEIRAAWVGLTLPLVRQTRVRGRVLGGVLTGPKTYFSRLLHRLFKKKRWEEGYLVDVETAVSLLESSNPDAARWWRKHTPHLLKPGHNFLFASDACREMTLSEARGRVWPPPPRDDKDQG